MTIAVLGAIGLAITAFVAFAIFKAVGPILVAFLAGLIIANWWRNADERHD
ncbi:MAG: hypothetical protein OXC71_08645 [Chloroflexi bacterium]|nr:hypothetical protein [Chloroflexota bacterium]